jgi:hypothetical protein
MVTESRQVVVRAGGRKDWEYLLMGRVSVWMMKTFWTRTW